MSIHDRFAVLIRSLVRASVDRAAASPSERSLRRAQLKVVLGVIAFAVVVFFFVSRAKVTAEELVVYWQSLSLINILLSFAVVLTTFGLAAGLWWALVRLLGGRVSRRRALRIYFLSSLPRYIPGSVWGYVSRMYLIEQQGVRRTAAVVSTMIEVGLFVASGFTIGLWYWVKMPEAGVIAAAITLAMIIGLLYVLILLNPEFHWSLQTLIVVITTVGGYLAFWIVYGLSIAVLIQQLIPVMHVDGMVSIISGFAISWLAGFLAIWVPGGLGIREAGIILILEPAIGVSASIFVAILSRLINLMADALLFITAIVVKWPNASS